MKFQVNRNNVWRGGGRLFLKTPFLLRFLAYLVNFVPFVLILPCDDRETDWPKYRMRATVSFECIY